MRAAFDSTYDAYYGPNSQSGTPGLRHITNQPCRVVPQTEISQFDFPFSLVSAWMTGASGSLTRPDYTSQYLGQWQADISTADQIAVPSGTDPSYYAIRLEGVSPFGRTPYDRIGLLPLSTVVSTRWLRPRAPIPPPPLPPHPSGTPGSTCAAALSLAVGNWYGGSVVVGGQQWYVWSGLNTASNYRVVSYAQTSNQQFLWYVGPTCGIQFNFASGNGVAGGYQLPVGPNSLWLQVLGFASADPGYAFLVSETP